MLQAIRGSEADDLQALYRTIAQRLKLGIPSPDFDALAATISQFEEGQQRGASTGDRIANPTILCAASEQFSEPSFGFDLDVTVVEKCFSHATIVRNLNSRLLRQLLTTQHFDIIHLVQAVDRRNGDLIFDPVEFTHYTSVGRHPDKSPTAGFADLVAEAGARLVVLNTCQALFLAARVAPVANMVAMHMEITGEAAAVWAESFYELLTQGYSVHKAYD